MLLLNFSGGVVKFGFAEESRYKRHEQKRCYLIQNSWDFTTYHHTHIRYSQRRSSITHSGSSRTLPIRRVRAQNIHHIDDQEFVANSNIPLSFHFCLFAFASSALEAEDQDGGSGRGMVKMKRDGDGSW